MKDLKDYCQDYILEGLRKCMGNEIYVEAGAIADFVTSYDMDNGTITMSEKKAMEYIVEWQWDAGEFLDDMADRFGKIMCNPFKKPGLFMVHMVREGCAILLNDCPIFKKYDDETKKITHQFIRQLEKELDEIVDVDW